jgi:hypothetical protein
VESFGTSIFVENDAKLYRTCKISLLHSSHCYKCNLKFTIVTLKSMDVEFNNKFTQTWCPILKNILWTLCIATFGCEGYTKNKKLLHGFITFNSKGYVGKWQYYTLFPLYDML